MVFAFWGRHLGVKAPTAGAKCQQHPFSPLLPPSRARQVIVSLTANILDCAGPTQPLCICEVGRLQVQGLAYDAAPTVMSRGRSLFIDWWGPKRNSLGSPIPRGSWPRNATAEPSWNGKPFLPLEQTADAGLLPPDRRWLLVLMWMLFSS